MTILKNGPRSVGVHYDCSGNKLNNLDGVIKGLTADFDCSFNQLITINGYPKKVRSFNCSDNQLSALDDCPRHVRCAFNCTNNTNFNHSIFWSRRFYQIICDDYLKKANRRENTIYEILFS